LLIAPKTIAREIRKFISNLKWLLLLAIIFFIPGLNGLSILIGGWLMAIQYLDTPADNQGMPFKECLARLNHNKLPAFLFGLSVMLVSMIPILNFLIIPAAVASATCLWHENYQP
jgi:CysZ protein